MQRRSDFGFRIFLLCYFPWGGIQPLDARKGKRFNGMQMLMQIRDKRNMNYSIIRICVKLDAAVHATQLHRES